MMLATQYQFDVFLSYARKDVQRAETLERELIACGLSVWRDVRGIDPAQDFTAEIENAIEASDVVVVCVTPDVRRSDSFVRREVAYAQAVKRPILVVQYEDTIPPISIINNTRFMPQHDNTAYARLCVALRSEAEIIQPALHPTLAADPFREALQDAYEDIVSFLNAAVPTVIELRNVETPEAVQRRNRRLTNRVREREGIPAAQISAGHEYENVQAALQQHQQRLLLLGEPGAGKTITLMATARNAIAARLADANAPLPLYADVATWDSENRQDFAEWFAEQYDVDAALIRPLIGTDGAMVFLDGLDELGDKRKADDGEEYDPRARFLEALPKTTPILLSCRVEEFKQIGQKAALRGAVTLEPLSDDQMQQYLAAEQAVWAALQADDKLREAFRTPLLLRFLREAFTNADAAEIRTQFDQINTRDGEAVRDFVFDYYIRAAYRREAARADLMGTPLTIDEPTLRYALGWAAMLDVQKYSDRNRLKRAYFPLTDARWHDFSHLCQTLHILVELDGDADAEPAWRFMHLLLYDYCVASAKARRYGSLDADYIRTAAAHLLAQQTDDFAPFTHALSDAEWNVRRRAAEALGRLGDARAVDPLSHALSDASSSVRSRAADALGQLGDARAVAPLIHALSDEESLVRSLAAFALGRLGDARAVDPLIPALSDADYGVRSSAASALGQLGDARAVDPLIHALSDANWRVRSSAAEALGRLGDARAVDPLTTALRDASASVRSSAAEALGDLGDARAVDPLSTALRDADSDVRIASAEALYKLGDQKHLDIIITALSDAYSFVRSSAAEALGRLGDARAIPALADRLQDGELSYYVGDDQLRVADFAADALRRIGTDAARQALIDAGLAPDAALLDLE